MMIQDLYIDRIEYQARVRNAEKIARFYQASESKTSWRQWFQTLANRSAKVTNRTSKPSRTHHQPA